MSPETPEDPQADAGQTPDEEGQAEVQAAEATAKAEAKASGKPARKRKAAKPKADSEKAVAEAPAAEKAAPAKRTRKPSAKKAAPAKEPAAAKPVENAPEPVAERPAETAAEPVAERPAEPAPRRASAPGTRTARRKVVRAHARYVRTSARKARMVCGHLRGKSVEEARAILAFTPREVARDWSKLLESAVANAESNHELLGDDLIVREAYADEGPTIKRFRPRAMGRATPIRKRTSHLTITLTPGPERPTNKRHG
ncbi:MAG: ribosomal protein [Solirubrobacterales bacterium]|nr:ribosomal protein [Solirubrobacterales bacterium]